MALPLRYYQHVEYHPTPNNALHLVNKGYVDAAVGGRVPTGGAALDYMGLLATYVAASSSYNVDTLPIGQKTVVERTGNLNLPSGSDTAYYMEATRGFPTSTIYQKAVGITTGQSWRRSWNGTVWTTWARPLMLSEYTATDLSEKLDRVNPVSTGTFTHQTASSSLEYGADGTAITMKARNTALSEWRDLKVTAQSIVLDARAGTLRVLNNLEVGTDAGARARIGSVSGGYAYDAITGTNSVFTKLFLRGLDVEISTNGGKATVDGNDIYHAGNLAPLDVNTGGTVLGNLQVHNGLLSTYRGTLNTQTGVFAFGWTNKTTRWMQTLEADASLTYYSYDASGTGALGQVRIRQYGQSSEAEKYRTFENQGGIRTMGPHAAIAIEKRNDGGLTWQLYHSTTGDLVFWSEAANADRFFLSSSGQLSVPGAVSGNNLFAGWNSGEAGSVSCTNWFRSLNATGILFSSYGGGLYMQDSTYVRTYGGKAFAADHFVNTGGHVPPDGAHSTAFRASGAYGGGYSMTDNTYTLAWYSVGGQHIFGVGTIGGALSVAASIDRSGVLLANDYALNSDASMKHSVEPLSYRGPLRPVTYRMKSEFLGERADEIHIGFIANEVKELYPELVGLDRDNRLTLHYQRITAVLSAQLNRLSDRVDRFESDNQQLLQELQALRLELQEFRRSR